MQRRDLLKLGGSLAAGILMPSIFSPSLFAGDPKKTKDDESGSIDWQKVLIIIELRGGNDGLNTVIPHADPDYYKLRGKLGIPEAEVVKLDNGLGLHPQLSPLQAAWKEGDLAICLGLGYPNPNRSHFRGIDIWNGGTRFDELAHDGWLGRVVSRASPGAPTDRLADGILLGYADSVAYGGAGPMFGNGLQNITMDSPDEFVRRAKRVPKPGEHTINSAVNHLLDVQDTLNKTADRMDALYRKAPSLGVDFPKTGLGNNLQVAAKLIAAGAICPVYKVTIEGFDTHAGQIQRHADLMKNLGPCMAALRTALKNTGVWDRTLVMTYSEFGRRATENDSGGTDHGTAAPHFLMGGKVKGGFYGQQPSLSKLDYGDLMFTTDYRQMYQTIGQSWFGYQKPFLSDKGFKPLACIKA